MAKTVNWRPGLNGKVSVILQRQNGLLLHRSLGHTDCNRRNESEVDQADALLNESTCIMKHVDLKT